MIALTIIGAIIYLAAERSKSGLAWRIGEIGRLMVLAGLIGTALK